MEEQIKMVKKMLERREAAKILKGIIENLTKEAENSTSLIKFIVGGTLRLRSILT